MNCPRTELPVNTEELVFWEAAPDVTDAVCQDPPAHQDHQAKMANLANPVHPESLANLARPQLPHVS